MNIFFKFLKKKLKNYNFFYFLFKKKKKVHTLYINIFKKSIYKKKKFFIKSFKKYLN